MSQAEALALLRAGRPQDGAVLIEILLSEDSTNAKAWFLLGACRHALNNLSAAARAFSRSIELDPGNIDAHLAYVSVLRATGDATGALAACRHAQDSCVREARVPYATALCLEDLGLVDKALTQYDIALRYTPDFEDALHNRGLLLSRIGRLQESEETQRRYIALRPKSARAFSGLADSLLAQDRFDEAINALDMVDRLANDDISARARRGVALSALGRFQEAKAAFADARRHDPTALERYLQRVAPDPQADIMLSPENIYLSRVWTNLGQCNWPQWDRFVSEMRRVARDPGIAVDPAVAFMCQHTPLSGAERHAIARRIAAAIEMRFPALPEFAPRSRPRIRIGILSPDFREHLDAYLLLPLFELLDRTRFEVFAYSLSADDGSVIRARVRSAADEFREVHSCTDRDAAKVIKNDSIDILLDVGGHSTGARFAITAQRPAQVQLSYLAFSCSLASPRLDYAIVDRVVGSDDSEWTEARIFLPGTYYLYDFREFAPSVAINREEYGLPEDGLVYCAFHKAEKISPDVFDIWMRIIARVPNSVLWFRALSETAARNLRAEAAKRGIDPKRLAFAPFEPRYDPRYLARHCLGDVMLDSLHHNAITTACDALGAGLPLITHPGDAFAARACESLVRAAGVPELVASSKDAYVELAVHLGTNKKALQSVKQRLASARQTAPLFDTVGRVRALEAAFREILERAARGEPPASFDVRL